MINLPESTKTFDFRPEVELLQVLARGSLKQNLPKAVRLWVILRSLYGDETDPVKVSLDETFTYSNWRDQFFTQPEFHREDKLPESHDPNCACAKHLSDWLFQTEVGVHPDQWRRAFLKLYPMELAELESLLSADELATPQSSAQKKTHRLFAMTRKNLQNDFKALVQMGWLRTTNAPDDLSKKPKMLYQKVQQFPQVVMSSESQHPEAREGVVRNVIQNDLVDFFEDFAYEINGQQRFFLEIDYIVHRQFSKRIHALRQQLKEIWQRIPVLPAQIQYVSARNFQNHQDEGESHIIYPVCLYYSHRAPYLFAYGQTPRDEAQIDWYDFRLDRIKDLQILDWKQVSTADFNLEICELKTPQMIDAMRGEAWGFDFYKPQAVLLIRFDRYFHNRYVEGTERNELFKQIPVQQAQSLVNHAVLKPEQRQKLLKVLQGRSQDVYCRLNYRQDDYNVIMRLRAWGPQVEVLLPWDLRELMARDIQNTWKLYQDE
ncbi:MAG: TIGR03985 family CRISPR-associated protein [Oscillatoriales cyanobacterium RM2_1_1]|nr:TIGR03985 family CRISPR-associated protein [Oscillatoriales cyanobacterium RM2_1_1]